MRVLVTGWPSFLHGEATAGDVLSMRRVSGALTTAGVAHELAWSPVFRPAGPHLADADPSRFSHLVFACGPAHGAQVAHLHERYATCRRIAVGVSVIDAESPAVKGFHRILARDGRQPPKPDLSLSTATRCVPVVGVAFAPGQAEYGAARRHGQVHEALGAWLTGLDCACVPLDTRLGAGDWSRCATADQFTSLLSRFDALVTTRLHGLVLGLRAGVPVLAVDPVAGGGKVSAQAAALGWPALVAAEQADDRAVLDGHWAWCRSPAGRAQARNNGFIEADTLVDELLADLLSGAGAGKTE